MSPTSTRDRLEKMLSADSGVLRLEPCWVARDFLPPGRRLGLAEHEYDVGERGFICERWLGSTTRADNRVGPSDEGLSYLVDDDGHRLLLRDAVDAGADAITGPAYAERNPRGLGRLAKLFDYADRLPYHIHPPQRFASLVGASSKDEGVHNVLIWSGQGRYAGREVQGGSPGLDELFVVHEAAVVPHAVENTGAGDLVVYKFFGPGINEDAPALRVWS